MSLQVHCRTCSACCASCWSTRWRTGSCRVATRGAGAVRDRCRSPTGSTASSPSASAGTANSARCSTRSPTSCCWSRCSSAWRCVGLAPWWLAALVLLRDLVIFFGALTYKWLFGPLRGAADGREQVQHFLRRSCSAWRSWRTRHSPCRPTPWSPRSARMVVVTTAVSGIDYILIYSRRAAAAHAGTGRRGGLRACSSSRSGCDSARPRASMASSPVPTPRSCSRWPGRSAAAGALALGPPGHGQVPPAAGCLRRGRRAGGGATCLDLEAAARRPCSKAARSLDLVCLDGLERVSARCRLECRHLPAPHADAGRPRASVRGEHGAAGVAALPPCRTCARGCSRRRCTSCTARRGRAGRGAAAAGRPPRARAVAGGGAWLVHRMPRDMHSLCGVLDRLDEAALAAQRRLTLPFLRQVLEAVSPRPGPEVRRAQGARQAQVTHQRDEPSPGSRTGWRRSGARTAGFATPR